MYHCCDSTWSLRLAVTECVCVWVWVGVGVGHAHLPSPAWLMAQVDLGVRKHDPIHAICIATHQG